MLVFHTHHRTCIITLAYFDTCILSTWMLALFRLHWGTYSVHVVVQVWWKRQCVSVSVEVSVFKGFSGRTLRNAFGKSNIWEPFETPGIETGFREDMSERLIIFLVGLTW